MIIANLHILAHLLVLDVRAELLLIANDLLLQCARFFHQVFVELILLHFAALLGKELHFLLDRREDYDLFIFVEDAITALIEDI